MIFERSLTWFYDKIVTGRASAYKILFCCMIM